MRTEGLMDWLCGCDKEATRLEVLWEWREAEAIGQERGRYVSYRCRIGCDDCVPDVEDERDRLQYFPVKLSASTKQLLVPQVVAQVLRMAPQGFLPKTDIQNALRSVHKRPG
jgi:hypothetical protein